jgi:hypothetical protein
MAEGIQVEVEDGFARIQFIDPSKVGPALTKLLELAGPELIGVDTRSGSRKIYIVPEGTARDAGLLDDAPAEVPEDDAPAEVPEDDAPGVLPEVDTTAVLPDGVPTESWTVAQMVDYASREEISLGGATKKADILAAITAANSPAV